MTNFDTFLSTPQFSSFASVAVSAERILQITLSAQCVHWAPLPKGEARGLPQDGGSAVMTECLPSFGRPLAPTLGELSAKLTERVKHPLRPVRGTSPKGRGKGIAASPVPQQRR